MVRPGPCISLLCMTWRIVSSVTMSSLPVTFLGGMVDKQGISGRRGFRRQPFPPFSTAPPPSSPSLDHQTRSHSHPRRSPEIFANRCARFFETLFESDHTVTAWSRCGGFCVLVVLVWWLWVVGLGFHRQKRHNMLPFARPFEQRMRDEIRK